MSPIPRSFGFRLSHGWLNARWPVSLVPFIAFALEVPMQNWVSDRVAPRHAAPSDGRARPRSSSPRFLHLVLFSLIASLAHSVFAQNPTGTLRGVIQDTRGRVVPSATIEVRAHEVSLLRVTTSDGNGEF